MDSILPTKPKEETPSILPQLTPTQQEQFPDRYLREIAERYAFRNNIPVDQALEKARATGPYSLASPATAMEQFQQKFVEEGLANRQSLEELQTSIIRVNRARNMMSVAGTATDKVETFAYDVDPTQKYLYGLSLLSEEVAARTKDHSTFGTIVSFVDAAFRETLVTSSEMLGDVVPALKTPLSILGMDKSVTDRSRAAIEALSREEDPEKMKALAKQIVDDWDKLGFLNNNYFLLSGQLQSAIEGGLHDHSLAWTMVNLASLGIGRLTAAGGRNAKIVAPLAKARDPVDMVGVLQGQQAGQRILTQSLANPNTVIEVERHTSPSILKVADPGSSNMGLVPVIENELSQKLINELSVIFRDTYTSIDQVKAATERLAANIKATTSAHVVDVLKVQEGVFENFTVSLKLGKADGLGWEDYFSAEKFANTHGGKVIRDETTDTFFVVQDSGLSLKGVAKATDIDDLAYRSTIKSLIDFNNRILSPEHTSSVFLNTLLKRGESRVGAAYTKIWKEHTSKFNKITKDELSVMNSIMARLRDGSDSVRKQWYNDYEFSDIYYLNTGKAPRKEVLDAYKSIWAVNDAAWYIDADKYLKNATAQGQFVGSFSRYKNLRMKAYDSTNIPKEVDEIFDVDRGSFIKPSEFKKYSGRNLLLVPDGIQVGNKKAFYVTGDLVESRALRHDEVLGYQPGGMRGTAANYFSVQEVVGTQIGGKSFIQRAVPWMASMSEKDALAATKDFNNIIKVIRQVAGPAVRKDMLSNFTSDDVIKAAIRANNGFNPSIENVEDFIKFLDDSGLEVADVAMKKADDNVPKIDIGKSIDYFQYGSSQTYKDLYRLNANPTSAKRNRITFGYGGRHFEQVDPTEAITAYYSKGLNYMSTRGYLKDAMEGLVKNGESVITNWEAIKKLPLIEKIKVANFKNDEIGRAFSRERQTILDRMNTPGLLAQKWEHFMQRQSQRLFEKGDDKAVKALAFFDKNPVVALRAAAYGTVFAFWNVQQFFVQFIGSALTATVVPPKYGLRSFLSYIPMRLAMAKAFDKPFFREVFRRAGNTIGMTSDDWDDMMYYMQNSGKFEVNLTTAYLDSAAGMSSGIPKFMNIPGLKQMYQNWDAPFKEGEGAGKLIAMNVAFREFREKFPTVNIKSREGMRALDEYITERVDALTFNMTRASQAAWQKGALGLATQWQAINARFLENLFFSRSLSKRERYWLAGSQIAMYGATGVAAQDMLEEVFSEFGIDPSPEFNTAVKHGAIDGIIHYTTGVPTSISERLAFVNGMKETFKDLKEGNLFEAMLGPSLSLGSGYTDAFMDLLQSSYYMNTDLMAMDAEKLIRQISSANSLTQSYYLWRYGEFVSRSGRTTEGIQNPKAAAILTALGFRLQQVNYPYTVQQMITSETEAVDGLVKRARELNDKRLELLSEDKVQEAAEVSKVIYALREPLPPAMKDYFDKKLEPFTNRYDTYLIDRLYELNMPYQAERLQQLRGDEQTQGVTE